MTPKPDSMWLVVVECRYNVIKVCVSGKGFYIPGQEPCWGFDHVQEWVREIVPPEMDRGSVDSDRICLGCNRHIDTTTCCCGEPMVGGGHDNHFPVPMGCRCFSGRGLTGDIIVL